MTMTIEEKIVDILCEYFEVSCVCRMDLAYPLYFVVPTSVKKYHCIVDKFKGDYRG